MPTPEPWRIIATSICDAIRSGRYPVGTPLPSTTRLVELHGGGHARGTVRRAVAELQGVGVLVGRPGSRVDVARVPEPDVQLPPDRVAALEADVADLRARVERLERAEREQR